ncbi:unnamed protein product [Psylliodes chrysocephalus]|uniref:Uncharacterized protein n=1 Tax=Psylliodes chrysocephalus TaxID=3402493 RepID=A0A9P0GJZ1_9CUCU|nr:unnamed protein product [Psylliodes chrysocephala]
MSFLNTLQEYVSNSVAGLSLKSPKRFSLTRTDTSEPALAPSSSRSNSGDSNTPGFPKVIPTPGAVAPIQRRRSTLECPVPAPPNRRPGSFRQKSPRATPERQSSFCCRRQSWPEIDHQVCSGKLETKLDQVNPIDANSIKTSMYKLQTDINELKNIKPETQTNNNFEKIVQELTVREKRKNNLIIFKLAEQVQEIDGSYFESFTALAWKQENQRQSILKLTETSSSDPPPPESELGITPIDYNCPQHEKEKLYVEMLYTIANTLSVPE